MGVAGSCVKFSVGTTGSGVFVSVGGGGVGVTVCVGGTNNVKVIDGVHVVVTVGVREGVLVI